MNEEQVKFIDRLYKDLYLSDSLKKHTTSKDKYKSIKEYIEFLESIHNKVINYNHIDILKKMYYDKYVINEENIPDSFYKGQEEAAFEMGYGHIEVGEREKTELNKIIIADQKESLDIWLDYLLSEDSSYIPFWAKYWAFQGMLKLGSFNNEQGKYTKRTKTTITKFADLNREALAISIDSLLKYLNKETINDKELEEIVKTGSFQSIYTYITNKLLNNNSNIIKRNEGKWIKYNQGTNYMPLVNSLQGYNTGWCTAGVETAKLQLARGDFYVYYTLNNDNEYKVPRIAIRMEEDEIAEIRGIGEHQNLEPEMEEVVKEKIKHFKDGEKYYKKASDMKKLTNIYKKHNNNEELTKEELIFLYELNSKIEGFGWHSDPRIEEIKRKRNVFSDIAYVLDIKPTQIANDLSCLDEDTVVYYGDLFIHDSYPNLPNLKIVTGECCFYSLRNAKGLNNLEYIGKDASFGSFSNLNGLEKLKYIGGNAYFQILEKADNLKSLKYIGGNLHFTYLEDCNGLENLEYIGKEAYFESLESAVGLKNLKYIGEYAHFDSLQDVGNILSANIGRVIYLRSIEELDPRLIPDPLTYTIILANNTIISPENVDKYRNRKII